MKAVEKLQTLEEVHNFIQTLSHNMGLSALGDSFDMLLPRPNVVSNLHVAWEEEDEFKKKVLCTITAKAKEQKRGNFIHTRKYGFTVRLEQDDITIKIEGTYRKSSPTNGFHKNVDLHNVNGDFYISATTDEDNERDSYLLSTINEYIKQSKTKQADDSEEVKQDETSIPPVEVPEWMMKEMERQGHHDLLGSFALPQSVVAEENVACNLSELNNDNWSNKVKRVIKNFHLNDAFDAVPDNSGNIRILNKKTGKVLIMDGKTGGIIEVIEPRDN